MSLGPAGCVVCVCAVSSAVDGVASASRESRLSLSTTYVGDPHPAPKPRVCCTVWLKEHTAYVTDVASGAVGVSTPAKRMYGQGKGYRRMYDYRRRKTQKRTQRRTTH